MDLNGLLHKISRVSNSESLLLRNVCNKIKDAFYEITPREKFFIAMDGPASIHKLSKQRKRREINGLRLLTKDFFDARQFTPGCLLMDRIEDKIIKFLSKDCFTKSECIVSGAFAPGEGEMKIFHDVAKSDPNKSKIVMISDGDAFIQALLTMQSNLFIAKPPWITGRSELFCVDRMLNLLHCEGGERKQTVLDLVTLVCLRGTDYTPSVLWADYAILWPLYIGNGCKRASLFVDNQINVAALCDLSKKFVDKIPRNISEPKSSHQDIVSFLASLTWAINHIRGLECSQPEKFSIMAPSMFDFSKMDVDRVSEDVKNVEMVTSKKSPNPGTAAIMMLNHEALIRYGHPSLHDISKAFRTRVFPNDLAALDWISGAVAGIELSLDQAKYLHNRIPVTINKSKFC